MAAQKLGDEHDTEAMPVSVFSTGSLMVGAELHLLPLNTKADESRASTAIQKRAVGQDTESGSPPDEDSRVGWLHVVPSYVAAAPDPSTAMQKLADGHDTDVGSSSLSWLESRCAAAPRDGAVLDCVVVGCGVAGWRAAEEWAPGLGGADDPLHPVAAPISRMDTQAITGPSRPVIRGRGGGLLPVSDTLAPLFTPMEPSALGYRNPR
jgi:hypothetical protein